MNKLLYTFLVLSIIFSSCEEDNNTNNNNPNNYTYIPDTQFEQELINLGLDDVLDDYVLTGNINDLLEIDLRDKNISDLTGIEDFVGLLYLDCSNNQITDIDITNNILLEGIDCSYNNITSLDLSQNTSFVGFSCEDNQITSLNLSNMPLLENIFADNNLLTSLDISQNPNVKRFEVGSNNLISLNVKNGNNINIYSDEFVTTGNPNLNCIKVDNAAYSSSNWTLIDSQHYFSETCP